MASPRQLPKVTAERIEIFFNAYLKRDIAGPTETPPFHREAWALVASNSPRVALAAPRGHAKSTAITLTYSLVSALFRRDPYVVVVSNTYDIATAFIQTVRTILTTNEDLMRDFGVDHLEKDTENDIICVMRDGYKFRFKALGFGQVVRGLNWGTQRPTLIMMDDVEDDEMVMSDDRRAKAEAWAMSALFPARDTTRARIRVVGTLLHIDAFLTNLLSDPTWVSKVWEAHDDNFEEILWPQRWSKDKLLEERSTYIAKNRLELYNMEYRNKVVDTSSGYFRKDEFIPMTEREKSKEFKSKLTFYAGGDFAWSLKEKSDYTVLPIVGVDHEFNLYVYFILRERMDGMEVMDEMFALQKTFDPVVWFPEKGATSKAIESMVVARTRETGVYLNLQFMPANKEKTVRARPLQGRMRAKSIKWDTSADWFAVAQQEMLEFPRGKHDDIVDALAHIAAGLADMAVPDTPEEEEEEEFFRRRSQSELGGGRDSVTGY